MKQKEQSSLNIIRENIILKGYASKTDIRKFCECGNQKAQVLFDELKDQTENEIVNMPDGTKIHKKINPRGISVSRLLSRLEMKESSIFKYAELERERNKK
ncbi:MAG: hypothetical protein RSF68_11555 [Myroides sp.]